MLLASVTNAFRVQAVRLSFKFIICSDWSTVSLSLSHRDNLKFLIRSIRPSLDGDVNQKVGVILLAHNLARTLSPLIGGYFADKYQKFKLIATIGYIAGKNSCFIDARLATPDQRMANFHLSGQIKDFFKSAIRQSFVIDWPVASH